MINLNGEKIIIASDIHGSSYYCKKLIDAYKAENATKLVLLGDLLYHGPRNALPQDYDCPSVIDILNGMKDSIICVRGNCDSEVDQMVLDFSISKDHVKFEYDGVIFFATHGHLYNTYFPPHLTEKYILLTGHTHIPAREDHGDYVYCNPGSVSIPKGGSDHGYILVDDGKMTWIDLDGKVLMSHSLI